VIGWTGTAKAVHVQEDDKMSGHEDGTEHSPMTQHYEDSIFKVTENGEFSVEVLLPDKKVEMGVNRVDLIIHNREDQDVAGARITVEPWMPSMGHGVMERPVVNEKGGGLYNVSNVIFSMTGDWELRIEITSESTTDTVKIHMPGVGAMGHTHTMKAPDKSKIDTSTEVTSAMGHFIVSYSSTLDPIPVNTLLSWDLTVKYADGRPVRDAAIKVLGDMPEHGHGFPTEPEVSGTMKEGQYLVEGLKFSMPGWWVVTFHVTAGDMADPVSFNLLLQ
jgi:hypothetical protein